MNTILRIKLPSPVQIFIIYNYIYILQVLEKIDRHWWYGCCGGKYGKFPASHLIAVEIPPFEDSHELFATIADFPRLQDGDLGFSRGMFL